MNIILYSNHQLIGYFNALDMEEVKNSQQFIWNTVQFPKIYEYNTYSELIDTYASMNSNYDILDLGFCYA